MTEVTPRGTPVVNQVAAASKGGGAGSAFAAGFAFLAAPFAWVAAFQVNYSGTAYLCGSSWGPLLYVVPASMLLLGLAGAATGYRIFRRARPAGSAEAAKNVDRMRALFGAAMALSAYFVLLIVVQNVPTFFLDPCRR